MNQADIDRIDLRRRRERLVEPLSALLLFEGLGSFRGDGGEQLERGRDRVDQALGVIDAGPLGLGHDVAQRRIDRG